MKVLLLSVTNTPDCFRFPIYVNISMSDTRPCASCKIMCRNHFALNTLHTFFFTTPTSWSRGNSLVTFQFLHYLRTSFRCKASVFFLTALTRPVFHCCQWFHKYIPTSNKVCTVLSVHVRLIETVSEQISEFFETRRQYGYRTFFATSEPILYSIQTAYNTLGQ